MTTFSASLENATIDWDRHIFLRSDDDTANGFLIPKSSAVHSNFMTGFMDLGEDQVILPVLRLENHILGLIAIYMNHFHGGKDAPNPTVLKKPFPHPTIDGHATPFEVEFSKAFLDNNLTNVIGLLNACNYLQVTPLLELASLSLAQRCKNKTPEEIKALFDGQVLPVRKEARES